jgi:hypothetical protein
VRIVFGKSSAQVANQAECILTSPSSVRFSCNILAVDTSAT